MLIVGLGNPGARYEHTRHNAGAEAVERLAGLWRIRFRHSAADRAWVAQGEDAVLARPDSYMNESGPVVAGLARRFAEPAPLLVVDELDLPVGTLRFRTRGSAGGHKGIGSVIAALGHTSFPRLKIGIGRPATTAEVVDYVLDRCAPEEREAMAASLDRAAEALRVAAARGLDRAMTEYSA